MTIKDKEITSYLGGKVKVLQNPDGYKSGTDAVMLASAVEGVDNKTRILELGSGVGVVSLCVLSRLGNLYIDSLEKQEELYNLALENKKMNNHLTEFNPILGNVLSFKNNFLYDKVIFNPPYFKKYNQNKFIENSHIIKHLSHTEDDATLKDFLNCAFNNLKIRGYVYIIYTSSRLQELFELLYTKHWGDIELYPIYSYENEQASRFIVKAKKLSKGASKLHYGLIVHKADGSFTTKAIDILKNSNSFYI